MGKASTNASTSQAPVRRVRGYPKLATTMTNVPEFTIFRKFANLNRLNLLRLQAELHALEEELREIQDEDEASGDTDRLDLTVDFVALRASRTAASGANKFQLEKMEEIAGVLKEYNAFLLQTSSLDSLPTPTRIQLSEYQKWLFKRQECGVNFPRDWENPYTPSHDGDQTTFKQPNPDHDPITTFLDGPVTSLVHRWRGTPKVLPQDGIAVYSDRAVRRGTNVLSAAISSLLPTVCVIVLYFIPSLIVRLVVMVVFTTIFAMALAFFTSGKKHEIFSAVAAFAAVEVVFIGSTSAPTT